MRIGLSPAATRLTLLGPRVRLIEAEQTNPPGIASTSTPKFSESRSSASSDGHDRSQLDDGVVAAALDAPGADDDARRRSSARSGVSKKNTCRIWASSGSMPRALTAERRSRVGDGELELDAVDLAQQLAQLGALLLGQ